MKRLALLLAGCPALLLGAPRPAAAADLTILAPTDRSVVKGAIQFTVKAVHGPTDQFLSTPEVAIEDEGGKELHRFRTPRNPQTGLFSAPFDTRQLRDGLYLVAVTYRTLQNGQPVMAREDLSLGVRNGASRPARVIVEVEPKEYRVGELCELTVKVLDGRGKRMAGARVTFKVDRGELDTDAEITDSDGEALASVDSEDPAQVTLTVVVENLPPVRKTIRFVE